MATVPPSTYQPPGPVSPHDHVLQGSAGPKVIHTLIVNESFLTALPLKPIQYAPDDHTAHPQPRQEQMQPTGQMDASEVPQDKGKLADKCTEQSQKKEEEGSGSGAGQPGQQQGRPHNYWHTGLFNCWDDAGTCESHQILPQSD